MIKQRIWLIVLCLLFTIQYTNTKAQGKYKYNYGEYLYSPFNDYGSCTTQPNGSCSYFEDNGGGTCFEKWSWSHGTPEADNPSNPESIFMFYGYTSTGFEWGEGIWHDFQFTPLETYNIKIGIKNLNHPSTITNSHHTSEIQVWAISNIDDLHTNRNWSQAGACGQSIISTLPDYIGSSSIYPAPTLLASYTVTQGHTPGIANNGPVSNEQWTTTSVTIPAGSTYDQILVMPYGYRDITDLSTYTQTNLIIDYVEVCRDFTGTVHYDETVPDGYTVKDYITVGNPAFNPGVMNNIGVTSELWAYGTTVIPNSFFEVVGNNHFLIGVKEECNATGYPGPSGLGKPGRSNIDEQLELGQTFNNGSAPKEQNELIHVYPNPSSGNFYIQLPQTGKYNIKITNMLGVTVYNNNVLDQQRVQVSLKEDLPSGNYILHLSGDIRHTQLITLTN